MRKRKLPERNPLRNTMRASLARVLIKSCGMKSSSPSRWGSEPEESGSNLGIALNRWRVLEGQLEGRPGRGGELGAGS